MVSGIRDNCIFELKKQPLGNTSPPSEGLGEAVILPLLTDTEVLKDIPQHLIRSNLSTSDIG